MTAPVPHDGDLTALLRSEVWKNSQPVLVAHLMRTYGEGFTEGLQMAAQLVQSIASRPGTPQDQRALLTEVIGALHAAAADVPPVWTPPPPEVIDAEC